VRRIDGWVAAFGIGVVCVSLAAAHAASRMVREPAETEPAT
jgi:hypothetical protein